MNAGAAFRNDQGCKENVEDSQDHEDTSSDVLSLSVAKYVNDSPIGKATSGSDAYDELTVDASLLIDEECEKEEEYCTAPSIVIGNNDCQTQEATAVLRDERLCTFEVPPFACQTREATASDVLSQCMEVGVNESPIPEPTFGNDVSFELTSDASFLSDEECTEEAEHSKVISSPSIVKGNNDCQIKEASARLRDGASSRTVSETLFWISKPNKCIFCHKDSFDSNNKKSKEIHDKKQMFFLS